MIFIVARTWRCASRIARREGLTHAQWIAWTRTNPADHKIRGVENPSVMIADCAIDEPAVLSVDDVDMIMSRYCEPGGHPVRVPCL